MKLYDSELNVLEVLWQEGDVAARRIVDAMREKLGWNKNTTYTVIKKCVDKGLVKRTEPGFICHALITKDEARWEEVNSLTDRLFNGSVDFLVASLLDSKRISPEQLQKLRAWMDEQE